MLAYALVNFVPVVATLKHYRVQSADSVEMGNGSAAAHSKDEGTEDQIIGSIGEWGRWQAKWFLVLCCVALPSGFPRYTQ